MTLIGSSLGSSNAAGSSSSLGGAGAGAGTAHAHASVISLVVAPVLARMLGVHQDKQVQKAIAQLKLAFDNLEKHKPSLSRDLLSQMFELVVSSGHPAVASLLPPSQHARGGPHALAGCHSQQQQQHGSEVRPPHGTR